MTYLDALFALKGKVALVTRSNRGIGFCLARALANAGAAVVLNGRDRERTEAAARELNGEGLAASVSIADVADREAVVREVKRIEDQFGAIDIVVNNAGIQRRAPFVDFPAEDFDAIMRANVSSARRSFSLRTHRASSQARCSTWTAASQAPCEGGFAARRIGMTHGASPTAHRLATTILSRPERSLRMAISAKPLPFAIAVTSAPCRAPNSAISQPPGANSDRAPAMISR